MHTQTQNEVAKHTIQTMEKKRNLSFHSLARFKKMFDNIKKAGFTEIERCSPSEANCIIRIYQDLHHEYEWGLCFNINGANCYTNINGIWETSDGIDNYPIEYDRHQFRMILMPDESLRVNADFVDCYVKIA